jgi:hypothetical protein
MTVNVSYPLKSKSVRGRGRALILAALVAGLSGCSLFKQVIDRIFPPVTSLSQRYASVEANMLQAQTFDANIGAYIKGKLLSEMTEKELKKIASVSGGQAIQVDTFNPQVHLIPQGIMIDADFDGVVKDYEARVKGKLSGMVSLSFSGDQLQVRPALEGLKLSKLRFENGKPVGVDVAALVNTAVKTFVDNINGAFAQKPIVVDLKWSRIEKVDLTSLITDPSIEVKAQTRAIKRHFAGSLIRIDSDGVAFLVRLENSSVNIVKENEFPSQDSGGQVSSERFKKRFQEYSNIFRQKWEVHLDPLEAKVPIELYVSKTELASLLNTVTNQPLSLEYSYALPASNFNEVVEAKKSQVDCQKVYEPFRRKRYKRSSCDWSCRICWDPCSLVGSCRQCADDPICKANRIACNVKEEAKVAEDNIEYELELAQHKLDQEARVAACNVWRETTSILAVGRFAGEVKSTGKVQVKVDGIQVDAMLNKVVLTNFQADVVGGAKMEMKITPHDLGHIFFCVAPTRLAFNGRYTVQVPTSTQQIGIGSVREGNDLVMQIQLPELNYKAELNPSPLEALITDADFVAKCSVGATIMLRGLTMAKAAGVLGLKDGTKIFDAAIGRYEGVQKVGALEFRIRPEDVEIPGHSPLTIVPIMGSKSVQIVTINPAASENRMRAQ